MSRRTFDKFVDLLADIVHTKRSAAKARVAGMAGGTEHSRDVYAYVCRKVAEVFVADGCKFAKSGPHITKKNKLFVYRIGFSTSRSNIPGQYVVLWMYANVRSPALKQWRINQKHPFRTDDWVAGGMAHLIESHQKYFQWEISDPATRDTTIADIVTYIRTVVLPYFEQFESPQAVIAELQETQIPAFGLANAVEFALCFGEKEQAERILNRFKRDHSDLSFAFDDAHRKLKEEGFPDHGVASYADQVAWVTLAYDLH